MVQGGDIGASPSSRSARNDLKRIALLKFRKRLEEVEKPLDLWMYFLKNGGDLDADALPSPRDVREIRRAM
jgi:hypothetical protein